MIILYYKVFHITKLINFKHMKNTFILIFISFILISCTKQSVVLEQKFDNNQWGMSNVEFKYSNNDVKNDYCIILEIELSDIYNADNFDIAMVQKNDDGETRYSSYSINVKNRMGDFIETKADSGFYTYSIMINPKTKFASKSSYYFSFEHRMSVVSISGIALMKLKINQL